jgi:FdrA protein
MAIIVNEVRRGFYMDSVALMRISRAIAAGDGVEEAGLMMGTPANKRILADAGVLNKDGEKSEPGDLILALRAKTGAAADTALKAARDALDKPRAASAAGKSWQPKTIRGAVAAAPDANLALISVPGDFAAAEARKALRRGLHVMMFSDNVSVADEVELKQEARALGLLVMGPDCGTAIINGVPLAFANKVPRGKIGIVGASGTGIQEVSCLIAHLGAGVSHAIGTGGRDMKSDVGGITTLQAIDLLDSDTGTARIVLISKPPAADVAARIIARVAVSKKPFTVCFLGAKNLALPAHAKLAPTLKAAAELATGRTVAAGASTAIKGAKGKAIRGLYSGGTLCAEAQIVLLERGIVSASNVPVPGTEAIGKSKSPHHLIDLGDDEYTLGRPHPMIEPAVRDAPLAAALADPGVGVILTDIVLGYGGHFDPAGHFVSALSKAPKSRPAIVASVTGVDGDPQGYAGQIAKLRDAGVIVAPSNADAAAIAARIVTD